MPIFFTKAGTFLVFFPVLGEDLGVFSSRTRAYPLFFVFFFTASPLLRNFLCIIELWVKDFAEKPSHSRPPRRTD